MRLWIWWLLGHGVSISLAVGTHKKQRPLDKVSARTASQQAELINPFTARPMDVV